MYKKFSLLLALALSLSLCGCEKEEVKEDMYLEGYITLINENEIKVVSSQGEFNFDITDCIVDSEENLAVDDRVEIYYSDELNEELVRANKIVPSFEGFLLGNITSIEESENPKEFTFESAGNTYHFKISDDSNVDLSNLDLSQIYDVEFDNKLSTTETNIATIVKPIEVDEAPVEELDIVENFNGTIED